MRIRFTRQCVKGAHSHSPIQRSFKDARGRTGLQRRKGAAGFRLSVARNGWLRSPSWPLTGRRLAQLRECKLNANTESRIRADNKAVPECALISNVTLLPCLRHVPGCGRNLALESRSICETDAMQRHEESTSLKTLLTLHRLAWGLRSNAGDQGLLMANGRS